jgi:hypothetical protein
LNRQRANDELRDGGDASDPFGDEPGVDDMMKILKPGKYSVVFREFENSEPVIESQFFVEESKDNLVSRVLFLQSE